MKKITKEDLANNPIPRLASCLVLDTSISMGKLMKNGLRPIDELNKGVAMYMDAISKDEKTKPQNGRRKPKKTQRKKQCGIQENIHKTIFSIVFCIFLNNF